MFDFLKKQDDSPPDVGKEDESEMQNVESGFDNVDSDRDASKKAISRGKKINRAFTSTPEESFTEYSPVQSMSQSPANEISNFELEKINARLEVINSFIKTFNERFSLVNQQIGEIRAMAVNNEKDISLSNLDAKKVIDVVKEVNPEKLRIDYQKIDFRVNTLLEKIEANKQFVDSIVEEFKELKRKANLFEGTDALLRLNQDVKKDLIEIQKVNNRVRMNADKSEQIFIELNKGFQENQKTNEIIATLDNSYSVLRKEFEKISMDHKQVLNLEDFNEFRKKMESKMIIVEGTFADVEKIKEENEKLSSVIERMIAIQKKNEEQIAYLSLKKGSSAGNVSEYDQKIFSMLDLVDKMSLEIENLKKHTGVKTTDFDEPIISKEFIEKARAKISLPKLEPPPEYPEVEMLPEKNLPASSNESLDDKEARTIYKRRITHLLVKGKELLEQNNHQEAIKIYEALSALYNPAEDENNLTYSRIIKFYDDILNAVNRPAIIPPVKRYHSPRETKHHKKMAKKISNHEKRHKAEKSKTEVKYSLATPSRKFKKLSDY